VIKELNLKQNNAKIYLRSQHISKLLFNIKSHDSFVIITVTQLMPPSKRREFRKDLVLDSKAWSTLKKRFLLFSYRGSCNKNDFLTSVFHSKCCPFQVSLSAGGHTI
jgi:hypothetical protein